MTTGQHYICLLDIGWQKYTFGTDAEPMIYCVKRIIKVWPCDNRIIARDAERRVRRAFKDLGYLGDRLENVVMTDASEQSLIDIISAQLQRAVDVYARETGATASAQFLAAVLRGQLRVQFDTVGRVSTSDLFNAFGAWLADNGRREITTTEMIYAVRRNIGDETWLP